MKRLRQYLGILIALIAYYCIHEGAHLIYALTHGVFNQINLMALGVQVDVFRNQMTDAQLGWFCLVGPIATFITAWVLVLFSKRICVLTNKIAKAIFWYSTLIFLLLDPLYLSVLYHLVGGGDMNGIRLLLPETIAAIAFGIVLIAHIVVVWKVLWPRYTQSFKEDN